MFCKKVLFLPRLHVVDAGQPVLQEKVILTVNCFSSQAILPDIRTALFSKDFRCSRAINKFRTCTVCRILNYSTGHLKVPGQYSYLFVKDKRKVSFSQEASKYFKGLTYYPRKICESLQEYIIILLPSRF